MPFSRLTRWLLPATCAGLIAPAAALAADPDPAPDRCSFNASTGIATYAWPTDYKSGDLPVIQRVASGSINVGRSNSVNCSTATIDNTSKLRIVGTPAGSFGGVQIVLDLERSLQRPDGDMLKIEFVEVASSVRLRINGTTRADHIVAGADGINLNADEATPRVDVTRTGPGRLLAQEVGCGSVTCSVADPGSAGADTLSTQGGAGTGGPAYSALTFSSRLIGGEGADQLRGNGWASLWGGPGDDELVGPGNGLTERATANFWTSEGPVTADLQSGVATGEGTDSMVGIDAVVGSPFSDTLRGNEFANGLTSGLGTVDDGDDTLEGRGGDDSLNGREGNDVLRGGAGEDTVSGGEGNDDLDGGADDDTLYGDIGTSDGNDGNDALRGGPGDDYLVPARGNDTVDGGEGSDMLSFGYLTAGVTFDLAITGPQDTGGGGSDTVTGIENVTGTEFSDVLRGDDGPNRLSGSRGYGTTPPANVDELVGRGGNDSLSLSGDQEGSRAFGGPGNDTIFGDDGANILDGGSGVDSIYGREGDDELRGPTDGEKDTLRCEEGTDTAVFDAGLDVLTDCEVDGVPTPPDPSEGGGGPGGAGGTGGAGGGGGAGGTGGAGGGGAPGGDAGGAGPPGPPSGALPLTGPLPGGPPAVTERLLPASLLQLPKSSTKKCVTSRTITVKLKNQQGLDYKGATLKAVLSWGSKKAPKSKTSTVKVKTKPGKRSKKTKKRGPSTSSAAVSLKTVKVGTFSVQLELRTADGQVARTTRDYRLCAPKKTKSKR